VVLYYKDYTPLRRGIFGALMEIQMTARISGPFGEINRNHRIHTPTYPREYLKHLVEIGVARVLVDDKPEPSIDVKAEKKSTEKKTASSSSQVAPQSQKTILKRLRISTPSRSTPTTK
jgi:hypothetical protein